MRLLAYVMLALPINKTSWRMGCVNSRTDINDLHPNVFQVMNVDDLGNLITPGKLEVTDSDIILYQKSKPPVKWPLRCLRRYGYDAEIFSFESGRRCSTGPGIYAFKCRRAAQLFNQVQTNIQQVSNNSEDTISRDMPLSTHSGPLVTQRTIPTEPNYLDPTPVRNNNRALSILSHNQQNGIGRLSSVGSSSGPLSPQETMGSPSPPPTLPVTLPPAPPIPNTQSSSLYANEEMVQSTIASDMEHNNNKNLIGRSIQRSHTVSSTSSGGFLPFEQATSQVESNEVWTPAHNSRVSVPTQSSKPSYMNVDLGSDASPLSPSNSTHESLTPMREEAVDSTDCNNTCSRAYMNISPGQESVEILPPVVKTRPPVLSILKQQSDLDDGARHNYANLEACELENLKKRYSTTSIPEKLSLHTPPPFMNSTTTIREMTYAVLDLDTKEMSSIETTVANSTTLTMTTVASQTVASSVTSESAAGSETTTPSSPPDSPSKSHKIGYVTIDFNKTAALSHSVNSSMANDIDEGSRKTRHNSTISEVLTSSTRHNSSISE